MNPPPVGGESFLQKILNLTEHSLLLNFSKNLLNIILLLLELQDDM
jgi:hypothetical protein